MLKDEALLWCAAMRLRPVLLLVCFTACAHTIVNQKVTTPARSLPDAGAPIAKVARRKPVDIDALRSEAAKLLEHQSLLYWNNWTTGAPIDVAATYKGHAALFSLRSIAAVKKAEVAEKDPAKRRALEDFEMYLAGEHIGQRVAPLADQVANIEGSATVSFDGSDVPYRNIEPMLANEPNHSRRLALSDSAAPVLAKLNPLLLQKEDKTEALITKLGYPSYRALSARMRGIDLDALGKRAQSLLDQTDALYQTAMQEAVHQELGLDLKDMRRADIPRFFHSADVQSAFPKAQMLPRFRKLLAGMGIDFDALKIQVDARALPNKNPRAVCFPIVVPTDVRLSIKPQGGVDDYAQLFHEGGHAVQFASTTTKVWAFQQLGDATVTEAYAFLFEDRLKDPRYLSELGMNGELLKSYVKSAAVRKLYMLRRYAAKVLFENAWHGPHPLHGAALKAKYQELLSRAYGFPLTEVDADRYLVDEDDFFYSADYLRAWFLAAQIDRDLGAKYGNAKNGAWWHSKKAGAALRALWANGSELTADEVVQRLGDKALSPKPLLARIRARLQ